MDYYETLGIAKDASADEVKKAYRKKASKAHPDRGGNGDSMALVVHAYEVLRDPEKRRVYDETGSGGDFDLEAEAIGGLTALINQVLPHGERMLQEAARVVAEQLQELDMMRTTAQREMRAAEKTRGKVRKKKSAGGVDLIHRVLDDIIKQKKAHMLQAERRILMVKRVGEMLKDYEADPPEDPLEAAIRDALHSSVQQAFAKRRASTGL